MASNALIAARQRVAMCRTRINLLRQQEHNACWSPNLRACDFQSRMKHGMDLSKRIDKEERNLKRAMGIALQLTVRSLSRTAHATPRRTAVTITNTM